MQVTTEKHNHRYENNLMKVFCAKVHFVPFLLFSDRSAAPPEAKGVSYGPLAQLEPRCPHSKIGNGPSTPQVPFSPFSVCSSPLEGISFQHPVSSTQDSVIPRLPYPTKCYFEKTQLYSFSSVLHFQGCHKTQILPWHKGEEFNSSSTIIGFLASKRQFLG